MPVVAGGIGVCHTLVDSSADIGKAVAIVYNAKVPKPPSATPWMPLWSMRKLQRITPEIAEELAKAGVELHCDKAAMKILKSEVRLETEIGNAGRLGQGIPRAHRRR